MGIYIGQQRLNYLWQKIKNFLVTGLSEKADKATTLSGYGIADAKITNGTITLGGSTITPLTSYTETDPTVPSWAKASTKPSYTASEVGALPDTYVAPVTSVNGQTGVVNLTIPTITISSTEPTSSDGNNGDIWIVI